MSYTINPNAKNKWARNAENTMDLSLETDASSVYLDNGRTLEQEIGEGSMVSNVATVDSAMSKVIDGTLDGAYESAVMYGKTMVNVTKPLTDITIGGNGNYNGFYLRESGLTKSLKTNTDYLFVVNVKSNTLTGSTTYSLDFGNTDPNNPAQQTYFVSRQHLPYNALGIYKFVMRTRDSFDGITIVSRNQLLSKSTGGNITFDYMILEYQQGMENWDIPFFTGLCDVKMPILRNVGKNLFDLSRMNEKVFAGGGSPNIINLTDNSLTTTNNNNATSGYGYVITNLKKGVPYRLTVTNDSVSTGIANFNVGKRDGNSWHEQRIISIPIGNTASRIIYADNSTLNLSVNIMTSGANGQFTAVLKNIQIEEVSSENDLSTPYEDYKTNILRTSEEIVLREVNGVQDTYNALTGEYVQRIGERGYQKEDLTNPNVITDGVKTQYELTEPITTIVKPSTMTPFTYQNGHVIVESGHEGQSLLPTLEYSTVINKTGLVENVAKTIQRQEKQLTMLEKMLIQNIINLDYNNTLLTLKNEMEEML